MCLSPKYITNRCLHYDLFKPLKLQVPCGKCEECKSKNRNDWFTRCYFEWQRCRESSFFYTLTYNNEHLPKYCGVQRFSKRDIQLFIKKLRFRLNKLDIKCKYIVTCEFGDKLKRCHYHVGFFLDKRINPFWFLRFVEDSWTDSKGESLGFVKSGDNVGLINSSAGIQYVTKYITKDKAHLNEVLPKFAPTVFKRYYDLFHYVCLRYHCLPQCSFRMNSDFSFSRQVFGGCSDDDLDFVQKFLTKMRRIMSEITPFHLQSTGLGSNMVEKADNILEQVPILQQNGKVLMSRIPRYIKRMLWYDCVEGQNSGKKDTFVLNEIGKKHLLEKYEFQIERDKQNYQKVLLNASNLHESILPTLNQLGHDFKHPRDVVFWCEHFDLDLEVLSIYKNIFRGRVDEFDIQDLNAVCIKDSWLDIAYQSVYASADMDFGEIYKNQSLVTALNSCLWNLNPFFQPYELALQILDCIDLQQRDFAALGKAKQEEKRRQLRQLTQMFNY